MSAKKYLLTRPLNLNMPSKILSYLNYSMFCSMKHGQYKKKGCGQHIEHFQTQMHLFQIQDIVKTVLRPSHLILYHHHHHFHHHCHYMSSHFQLFPDMSRYFLSLAAIYSHSSHLQPLSAISSLFKPLIVGKKNFFSLFFSLYLYN